MKIAFLISILGLTVSTSTFVSQTFATLQGMIIDKNPLSESQENYLISISLVFVFNLILAVGLATNFLKK